MGNLGFWSASVSLGVWWGVSWGEVYTWVFHFGCCGVLASELRVGWLEEMYVELNDQYHKGRAGDKRGYDVIGSPAS